MSLSRNEIKALPAGTIVTAATMAGGTKRVATAIATVGHRWSVSGNTYPMGDLTLSETYTDIEVVLPPEFPVTVEKVVSDGSSVWEFRLPNGRHLTSLSYGGMIEAGYDPGQPSIHDSLVQALRGTGVLPRGFMERLRTEGLELVRKDEL